MDPYSILVVLCLVIIWIVLGVMFIHRYCPGKIAWPTNSSHNYPSRLIRGVSLRAAKEEVSGKIFNKVTITVNPCGDPPTCGDPEDPRSRHSSGSFGSESRSTTSTDRAYDGSQNITLNGVTGGGASSEGSSDGSHSDMSEFDSLHSTDEPQRRSPAKSSPRTDSLSDVGRMSQPRTLSTTGGLVIDERVMGIMNVQTRGGPQSELSRFRSLHSNDQPQRKMKGLGIMNVQTRGGTQSELSRFRSLHSNDQHQRKMTLNGKAASQGSTNGSQSDVSGYNSLHSNDRPQKRKPSVDAMKMVLENGKSSHFDILSEPGTLASTEIALHDDDDSKVTQSGDSIKTGEDKSLARSDIMSQPGTLASTEVAFKGGDDSKTTSSVSLMKTDVISQPGTLASTEIALDDHTLDLSHCLGRPLSDVGGSSAVSCFRSLRSSDSPQRRPEHRDPSQSLPAVIAMEKDSEDLAKSERTRWRSL